MAGTSSEVIVGGTGAVYVGPTGTAAPTDATTALNASFKDLGYLTEDGITITDDKATNDIMAWQSFYPVRSVVTGRTFTVSFTLMQWNENTLPFALGGGTLVAGPPATYVPPTTGTVDERALVLEWDDDVKDHRVHIPRGVVSEAVAIQISKNEPALLPVTFKVTPASTDAYTYKFFTDDAAYA